MTQYIFPDASTQDVCFYQDTTGMVNLIINGNLANNGTVSFITNGYSRQLSFTSINNLSATNFTIYGFQNGVEISEVVAGPNNNTVYSTLVYDVVTAVTTSGAVAQVAVGTGYNGFFTLINPNLVGLTNFNYNFTLGSKYSSNVIGTTIYGTLNNIANNGTTFANIIATNVGTLYTIKTFGNQAFYMYPNNTTLLTSILIQLTGSTSTIGNTTTLTFLQLS